MCITTTFTYLETISTKADEKAKTKEPANEEKLQLLDKHEISPVQLADLIYALRTRSIPTQTIETHKEAILAALQKVQKGNLGEYSALIVELTKIQATDVAISVILQSKMVADKVKPNTFIFNVLLSALVKEGKIKQATQLLNTMKRETIVFDKYTYTSIIELYIHEKQLDRAIAILNLMQRDGLKPDIVLFATLLTGALKLEQLAYVKILLRKMGEYNIVADTQTWNSMIKEMMKQNDLKKALGTFELMKQHAATHKTKKGLPDIYTYNLLISGFARANMLNEALKFFEEMHQQHIIPDIVTYTSMLDACTKVGNLEKGQIVIELVKKNNKVSIDPMFCISMVNLYLKTERFDLLREMFIWMKDEGVSPDKKIVSKILLYIKVDGRLDALVDLFVKLRGVFWLDLKAFHYFIDRCAKERNMSKAMNLVKRMVSEIKVYPNSQTYELMLKYCDELGDKASKDELQRNKYLFYPPKQKKQQQQAADRKSVV